MSEIVLPAMMPIDNHCHAVVNSEVMKHLDVLKISSDQPFDYVSRFKKI